MKKSPSYSKRNVFEDPLDAKSRKKPTRENRHVEKHMRQALREKNVGKLMDLEDDY